MERIVSSSSSEASDVLSETTPTSSFAADIYDEQLFIVLQKFFVAADGTSLADSAVGIREQLKRIADGLESLQRTLAATKSSE